MSNGAVNNVTVIVENANFGDNMGTINQGREASPPTAGSFQNVPIGGLDLIQVLQPISDASHTRDREISPPNSACFPGTRREVIRAIMAWANSSLLFNTHVLWLYGYVGCGKSAIALAIALRLERSNRLVGSFFFFRNTGDRSRMTKFATTLACQLAAAIPEAAPFIEKAIRSEPGLRLGSSSLVSQLRRLVYEPFKAAAKWGRILTFLLEGPFLIVIDGLDECEDRRDVEIFIDDMLEFFEENPFVPLRFLITSRVEQHVQGRLENNQVRLMNLVNHCSRDDIDTFLTICFEDEKKRNPVIRAYIGVHGDWPTKADKDQLVDHIGGSFIFASGLFKYIVDPSNDQSTPMDRLPHTLKMNPGLDTLYAQALARSQHLPHFPEVISTLAFLSKPLPIVGIAELLGIEPFEVVRVLLNLQAIIHIPGTDEQPVTFCHTSLRDFLTTESRSGFFFVPASFHLHLIYRCSILREGPQSGTSATLYSIQCFDDHIEQLIRFTPSAQRLIRPFPRTLDAFYTEILFKSPILPHFMNIISTIALLLEPLPIASIARLLGIEVSEVVQVLVALQAIVHIPGNNQTPVTWRHISVRDFLTTESRSGCFFAAPSYHFLLLRRCFILRKEQQSGSGSAAVSYSTDHCDGHIEEVTRLPRFAEQLLLYYPQTLDALYNHVLAKSQPLPHFSQIISTIAFLFEPLPIVAIAELLNVESVEVVQVLDNLRAIVHIPRTDDLPVTFCHGSLRKFLTTKSRSGPFFISFSPYHLELSYRCFALNLEHCLLNRQRSLAVEYAGRGRPSHWARFLAAVSPIDILVELERFTRAPSSQALSHAHFFTFTLLLSEMLRKSKYIFLGRESETLVKCMEFLALALEKDPAPARWLHQTFQCLGFSGLFVAKDLAFDLRQEQTPFQDQLQRLDVVMNTKCPGSLSRIQWDLHADDLCIDRGLGNWTAMDAYCLFKWMSKRLGGPGDTCYIYLRMIKLGRDKVTIRETRIHVPVDS